MFLPTWIKKFSLTRFKQFEDTLTVELQPTTVLVGANNSGKSTILQALNIFHYCLETCLERDGNGKNGRNGKWILKSQNVAPAEFGRLPIASPDDLWPQGRVRKSIEFTATFDQGATLTFEVSLSYNLFRIQARHSGFGDLDAFLRSFGIRLVPVFSGIAPREDYLVLPALTDRLRMQDVGSVVRNLLHTLKTTAPDRWKLLTELLHKLYPEASIDVDYDEELATRVGSARIDSAYADNLLTRNRDLIVAGSGLHQVVQLLVTALQPGRSVILLDEPDAHLHARLQTQLMGLLAELQERENLQFIIATHSPQILKAAPTGSVMICHEGKVIPFAADAEQMESLETLGVLDRMELVPLVQTRRVVFVENQTDRKLLEAFARRLFGKNSDEILRGLSFLYTYQEPVAADVTRLARQVKDVLAVRTIQGEAVGAPQFVALGDRDYRLDDEIKKQGHELRKAAKSAAYSLDFRLFIWPRAEIENYLLDLDALCRCVASDAKQRGKEKQWKKQQTVFRQLFHELIEAQRRKATLRLADHIQDRDRGLRMQTAHDRAEAYLADHWGDGIAWVDAKVVLRRLRTWTQEQGIPSQLTAIDIIEQMDAVPADVEKVLRALRALSRPPRKRSKVKAGAPKKTKKRVRQRQNRKPKTESPAV